jgi:hypothetical protein
VAIPDSKPLQSTPESGNRAGYDGHKRKKGTKLHAAVATLGYLRLAARHPSRRAGPRPSGAAGRREREQEQFIEQLYQQIGQLKVEVDWLRKKSGVGLSNRSSGGRRSSRRTLT